ncbi:tRNA preQ1(34) S-adenosylmethionine ribosyltransferase-isomerase QueA [Candidatus Uhrbacteria bacterium]|nr:tRNA preQ1(34) S-adenosylmethionine ribosyltransferase-isomerase QueA [Candidatus Uhrbacteria bacterium]
MATPTSHFDYVLPPELIAQHSVVPRDHSRLMRLDRESGAWEHKRFYEILGELHAGDVLVMNNTKVFRARLVAHVHGRAIELFLLRPRGETWDVLVRPGRHMAAGDTITVGAMTGRVVAKSDVLSVRFDRSAQALIDYANLHGEIPVPPYVHETPADLRDYQTVYARETGSVAAPTAGFHFTQELLKKIREKGVEIREVTLHVGLGTFRPMKTATIEEHEMHAEFVTILPEAARAINAAKREGRRVIAVGTTSVRTLEGVAAQTSPLFSDREKVSTQLLGPLRQEGYTGDVNLFITPGFSFKVVDALITNFHLPRSTLLVLVAAFAGRERVLAAYEEAVRERYRFFSFGDAMFIR